MSEVTNNLLARRKFRGEMFLAVGLASLLYILTLSRNYSADSLLYALTIESNNLELLLDPTHVLLHPIGWIWFQSWKVVGWNSGSLVPLGVLNALGGAASVGLMYSITRHLIGTTRLAALVSAGFAVSGGLWLLSVEAEFATIPLATQMLVLWLIIVIPASRAKRPIFAILIGLAVVLAILTYLSNLILIAVVVAGFFLQKELPTRLQGRQVLIFLLTVMILLVPTILMVLLQWTGGNWARLAVLTGGNVYGQLRVINVPHGLYAFLRSMVLLRGLALNDSTQLYLVQASNWQRIFFFCYYLLVLLLAVVPLLLVFRFRFQLWHRFRRSLSIVFVWSVLYASFAFFWVPGDITFWLPLLAAWWLLVAMLVAIINRPATKHPTDRSWQKLIQQREMIILMAIVLVLAGLNAWMIIIPRIDLSNNPAYELAQHVSALTTPKDVIVADPDDLNALYIIYFAKRRVVAIESLSVENQELISMLTAEIQQTEAKGGKVYLLRNESIEPLMP